MEKATPLNNSLNKPRERWGLPLPVIFLLLAICICTAIKVSLVLAIIIGVGLPALSKWLVSRDVQIYHLTALSLFQNATYDPGKRPRC